MRLLTALAVLTAASIAAAQKGCPPTITVTEHMTTTLAAQGSAAPTPPPTTSSRKQWPKQTITYTTTTLILITANGTVIERPMTKEVLKDPAFPDKTILARVTTDSCPGVPKTTVTFVTSVSEASPTSSTTDSASAASSTASLPSSTTKPTISSTASSSSTTTRSTVSSHGSSSSSSFQSTKPSSSSASASALSSFGGPSSGPTSGPSNASGPTSTTVQPPSTTSLSSGSSTITAPPSTTFPFGFVTTQSDGSTLMWPQSTDDNGQLIPITTGVPWAFLATSADGFPYWIFQTSRSPFPMSTSGPMTLPGEVSSVPFPFPFPWPSSTTSSEIALPTEDITSESIDPNFWIVTGTDKPTLTIASGESFQLPCTTLREDWTITPPAYTTSLCQPHCGDVNFKSKTTIVLNPITTSILCFHPMAAELAEIATAVPMFDLSSTISAPAALSTCEPHHITEDNNGRCGPDEHYSCKKKECCSKDGKCGKGIDFCDVGCQPNWGYCWKNSTSCRAPSFLFGDDADENLIPIYPVWDDPPDPPGPWPPIFHIEFGSIHFPPSTLGCPICPPDWIPDIWGHKGECGLLGCDGIDLGWFLKFKLPKLGCPAIIKWICHHILKCCCCGAGKSGDDQSLECPDTNPICDTPGADKGLDGNGKLCDEDMENCEDITEKDDDGECSATSTVTDQTIYCDVVTKTNGETSRQCTSTAENTRQGCTVVPKTTSVTTTACETTTARHTTESCSVLTGANATITTCGKHNVNTVTGCDVSNSLTSVVTTDCSTTNTVTDMTKSCFAMNATTINGQVITPSMTCTATASNVYSGCDISGSTTTEVSTSEPVACLMSGRPQIQIEPEFPGGQWPIFAGNITSSAEESSSTTAPASSSGGSSSTATCLPPIVASLPACTPIAYADNTVTEVRGGGALTVTDTGPITMGGIAARAEGDGVTATSSHFSCWCGSGVAQEIWPVATCGTLMCPNQATTSQGTNETPAAGSVVGRAVGDPGAAAVGLMAVDRSEMESHRAGVPSWVVGGWMKAKGLLRLA